MQRNQKQKKLKKEKKTSVCLDVFAFTNKTCEQSKWICTVSQAVYRCWEQKECITLNIFGQSHRQIFITEQVQDEV